jgi:hypothetical protein
VEANGRLGGNAATEPDSFLMAERTITTVTGDIPASELGETLCARAPVLRHLGALGSCG